MDFLHLSHAAAPLGGALVSAFSAFHAFDYLHERAFDAVILNAAEDKDLAYAIASAMRRNTRLYHTPAILLCRGNCFAEADEAFARGASDLLPAQTEPSEIRARLTAFAQERRRRRAAKALLEACRIPKLLDPQSGLFDNSFGLAHLESLIATGARRGRPLPIALIRLAAQPRPITGPAAPREESALTQFAGLLRHCVRTEDFVFRLRDLDFVLALPETDRAEAETVLARVRAIAECTVYPEIGGRQEVRFDLQSALLEARPGEPAAALAARALARLFEGPARAAI